MAEQGEERQFRELAVSELFCGSCRRSRRVRRVLLFEIPHTEYEYRCVTCDRVVGSGTDDDGEDW